MDLEILLRKILLVKGPVPNPSGFKLVPKANHFEFELVDPEQVAKESKLFHAEGKRAQFAHKANQISGQRALAFVQREIKHKKSSKELAQARTLEFTSHYIHHHKETSLDGHFKLKHNFYLEIISAKAYQELAEEEWNFKPECEHLVTDKNNIYARRDYVIVPFDVIDESIALEAIKRWYKQRFEDQKGHWSNQENRLPEIIINLAWDN